MGQRAGGAADGAPVADRTSTTRRSTATRRRSRSGARDADFSHDNDMMGVYAALGLHNGTELDPSNT